MKEFRIEGKIFKYPGVSGWHFIGIEKKIAEKIKEEKLQKVGFSFVKVRVKIGKTSWNTTLFPTKEGQYLISIKSEIRKKENIFEGDDVKAEVTLL